MATGKVDVCFRVTGGPIAADHGYKLYAAMCRTLPFLHVPHNPLAVGHEPELWREIGIQTINGRPTGKRRMDLVPASRIRIRIGREDLDQLLPLRGEQLKIDDDSLMVGPAEVHPLTAATRLRSRIVVIKKFLEVESFLEAANRQLRALGIAATAGIPWREGMKGSPIVPGEKSPLLRRTLRIADYEVVGYAVEVNGLTAEESIALQETGLGGRRRFGCGIFVPSRN